jgi:NADH dehydrogenase FAD-containing subunit
MSAAKRLAIIGGGMAGHQIAFALQREFAITLIDPKTYFEVPMAAPRLLAAPDALPARMAYADFLPHAHHVQGRAISLSNAAIEVASDGGAIATIQYDFAVIAAGSRYGDPLIKAEAPTEDERAQEIDRAHQRLRAAAHVVIVGGGAVGVETAAELRETLPHVAITLIHDKAELLDMAPEKLRRWALEALRARGVKIVLGERVTAPVLAVQPDGAPIMTDRGRRIIAQAIVWAAGVKPSSDFVARGFPDLILPNGTVATDEYLRLKGAKHIFVAGDLTSLPEGRLGLITGFHADCVTRNLRALAKGAAPKRYAPKTRDTAIGKILIVTLGPRDGLASLPFGQFRAPFIARAMKSKDMLVTRYRKGVGMA